jgi:hypothetical protein
MEERKMGSIQEVPRSRLTWPIPTVYSALAVVSLATAGIHFAVMGDHFREYVAFGIFFAVVAWFQSLWALGVVVSPTRSLLLIGAIVNALVVVVWLVSRTIGLPIGPDPGIAEPAAFLDVLSTVLEVVIVASIATLLVRGAPGRATAGARSGLALVGGLAMVLVLLTTVAVASMSEEAHGHEEEGGSAEAAPGDPALTRVELGEGHTLQALVEGSDGTTQIHLTFFDADGAALDVEDLSVSGLPPSGSEVPIPVERFEPGHYAATADLARGAWEFHLQGQTGDGHEIDTHFEATVT